MTQERSSRLPARISGPSLELQEAIDGQDLFGMEVAAPRAATSDARRIRAALWRFAWLIATLPVLAAAGGYAASRIIKPVYIASATVWINKLSDAASTRTPDGGQFGSEAWVDLFRSYTVIDRVVSERHLSLNLAPPIDSTLVESFAGLEDRFSPGSFVLTVDRDGKNYVLTSAKGLVLERRPVGGPIGVGLGFKWTPPAASLPAGKSIAFTILSPRQAAISLLDRLKVRIDGTGTFLHSELSGNDPATVASALNSIVDHFVEVATKMKSEGLADRTRILQEQLRSAQQNLATAETALEQFRLQSILRPNARISSLRRPATGDDGADPASASYFSIQASMDAALRERQTIRRVLAEVSDSGLVVAELERLPSVIASSELSGALKDLTTKRVDLQALRAKYTDSHPLVIKARTDLSTLERVTIPDLANRVIAMLSAREAELAKSAAATERDLREEPALANTEARLQRNVTLAEGLYSQLQPRFAEAELAEGSAVPDVKPLDRAEAPQFADKILTKRLVIIAFLAGLGLACAGAILLDRIDPKFRYPDQISDELGITILGALPHVKIKGSKSSGQQDHAAFRESIRNIRMNVEYSYGSASPLIITISSPGASDGKSFLSSNLARSFADTGRRTLLIDADLRRGELHRRCSVSRRPGLTDCLRGEVPLDRIIQQSKFPMLDIIASGTRKHDAPELLGSQTTAQLLGELRALYDVIVCDSPPLSAGIDPFVLAALSGNLVLIVRRGVSVREVIESKLETLRRMPIRILGAVLNDVPQDSIYGYYSNYVPGYDTTDETGATTHAIIL